MGDIKIPRKFVNLLGGALAIAVMVAIMWMTDGLGIWNLPVATLFMFVIAYFWVVPFARFLSDTVFRSRPQPEKQGDVKTEAYIASGVFVLGLVGFLVGVLTGSYFISVSWRPKDWPGCIAFILMSYLGTIAILHAVGYLVPAPDCSDVTGYSAIFKCYVARAVLTNNATECDNLNAGNANFAAAHQQVPGLDLSDYFRISRAGCYGYVAAEVKDDSLCDSHFGPGTGSDQRLLEYCYYAIAYQSNDSSTCYKLQKPDDQSLCLNQYSQAVNTTK